LRNDLAVTPVLLVWSTLARDLLSFNCGPATLLVLASLPLLQVAVHRRILPLLVAASLVAAPLRAQTAFTLVDGGPVSAFGYQVGPYDGIMGSGSSAQSLFLYCVDVAHTSVPGEEWTANLTSLGTGIGIGTNTRSADLARYRQAAWLTTQYALHPEATADIQATIWNLFGPVAGVTPSSDYWFVQAMTNYASLDYSGFVVVTDVNKDLAASAQEVIVVTPEPASAALLATGLFLVVAVAGRRAWMRRAL
jgi:hypothetical protein